MGNAESTPSTPTRGGCCGLGAQTEREGANIKDDDDMTKREGANMRFAFDSNQSLMEQISGRRVTAFGENMSEAAVPFIDHSSFTHGDAANNINKDWGSDDDDDLSSDSDTSVIEEEEEDLSVVSNMGGSNYAGSNTDGNDEDMVDSDTGLECEEDSLSNSQAIFASENNRNSSSPGQKNQKARKPQSKILMGHANWVEAVATNGTKICSAGVDEDIKIWDAANGGSVVMTLSGHIDVVTSVAISHDGKNICSGSVDKTVRIWDMATGKEENPMYGHTDAVTSVAYSCDDVYVVSGSIDNTMRLWNVYDGVYQCVQIFQGHTMAVDSVDYSPDGNWIISGSEDASIRIWDPKSGECVNTIRGHTGWFYCVAHAPIVDEKPRFICTGSHIGNVIDIWNAQTRTLCKTMKGHTGPVLSIAYSHDGRYIASGSVDHTVRLWNAETGACVAVLEGHSNIAGTVAFGSDGENIVIVSGSRDHEVRMWYVNELAPGYFEKSTPN